MSRPSAEDERWHVDGLLSDETFASESAAIARAWELTPPGGKRPAVRRAAVMRGQELRGIALDEIFDVPESMLGGTEDRSIDARITAVEMVMERDKEFVRAVMTVPMSQVMAKFSNQQSVENWIRLRFEVLVSDHIKEPVALTSCGIEIEEDSPPTWTGTLSPSTVERQRMVARGTFERVSVPPF